jgi:hypothetical protein
VDAVRYTGSVTAHGRWNQGPWRVLARTRTYGRGFYRLSVKLNQVGVLDSRISTPDGYDSTKTIRVTKTR